MTTATAKTRQRRARATAQALIPRGQHLIDQGADMLILSARCASTPEPVFWAEGELDARTTLAVQADPDWDDNYRRVFEDPSWWDWNWYRDAKLADERAAVPVIMPGTPPADDDPELTDRVNKFMSDAPIDVPGADGPPDPAPPKGTVPGPASTPLPLAAGPGTPDDPALD